MQLYVKRTQCDYSLSFKLSVVRQIERGEMTYTQAARHYGIQSKGTVLNCMHKLESIPTYLKQGKTKSRPKPVSKCGWATLPISPQRIKRCT